jgi:cytochrome P450
VDAFPEPETFNPNRWIGPPDEVRARERCLVPFGRGSRNCVGQNLAMCQMYYTLGTIFHCFDNLQVYHDFGREDLEMVELLIGYHPRKAKKFKIVKKRSVVSGA